MAVFAADGHRQKFFPKLFALFTQVGHFGFGHLALFGILGSFGHFLTAVDLVGQPFESAILSGDFGQPTVFARSRAHPCSVGQDFGVGHVAFKLLESFQLLFQRIADATHDGCSLTVKD